MMRKTIVLLIVALAVVAAGVGIAWAAWPDDPAGGDEAPTTTSPEEPAAAEGPVYIDSVELLMLESWPVQVHALIKGDLPTPCHHLTWDVGSRDASGRIILDIYTIVDADAVCVRVLEPFEQSIAIGSFTTGSYVLVVDGLEYPFTI